MDDKSSGARPKGKSHASQHHDTPASNPFDSDPIEVRHLGSLFSGDFQNLMADAQLTGSRARH